MGRVVAIQYAQATDIPVAELTQYKLSASGYVKITWKFSKFIKEIEPVKDPVGDILKGFDTLNIELGELAYGGKEDIQGLEV